MGRCHGDMPSSANMCIHARPSERKRARKRRCAAPSMRETLHSGNLCGLSRPLRLLLALSFEASFCFLFAVAQSRSPSCSGA